ncbi:MAG TPA: universal stress protein [Solirubrobacteraceae bacterium]|nr:universal stress protein [Solirubrobacteraceae bacterium]
MFKNAVVGVDGSSSGQDAVALASRLLDDGGRLTLVHVHHDGLHPFRAISSGFSDEERAASEKLLRDECQRAGVHADLVSAVGGSPAGTLHEQAEERGADLLVVGSSRRSVLGRVMLGDDARRALNGAPCAVATAAQAYAEAPKPPARIGVAYNDTPESRAALQAARAIAGRTGAKVYAREVISIPTYAYTGAVPAAVGDEIDTILAEANRQMAALEGVEGSAAYGLTGEELAAFGDNLDLLVVGSRSYGPFKRLVLGSTSDYLQRHARCSLLVLPRGAAEGAAAGDS